MEGRKINWMKAGILEADRVLTVSPYYAEELISGIARGCELDNIMRLTGITGIVNGMDVSEWDPSRDKYIAVKYDVSTVSWLADSAAWSSCSCWFGSDAASVRTCVRRRCGVRFRPWRPRR